MWGNIFSVLFLTHVFLRQSALCLNFEAALDQGMFEAVVRDQVSVKLDYADTPSKAMMVLGKEAFPGTSPKKYQVNISIDDNLCASPPESYDYEMSLTILKYEKGTTRINAPDPDSDPGSSGRLDSDSGSTRLDVYVNDGQYVTWSYEDVDDRPDPYAEHLAENQAVFRTWTLKFTSGCDQSLLGHSHACQKNLRLELSHWTPGSSLYFVSTLHKRRLTDCVFNEDAYSNGCPNQPARDFACNVDSFPLCIPYDKLTCNLLPNCAQNKIPNDDEKCSEGWNFAEALRFIIYTLLAISLLLIVTGCIRTCVNRSRSRNRAGAEAGDLGDARPEGEDGVSEAEYGAGAIPRRPANAPPTYDDAVKPRQHQNYGFLPDELPPSYTEVDFAVSEVASAAVTSAVTSASAAASTETAARRGPNGAAAGPDAFSPQPRPALSGWQLPPTTPSGVPPVQNPIWYIGDQSAGEATAWLNTTAPAAATSSAGPAPAVTQVGLSGVGLSGDELSGAASATSRQGSSDAAQDQTNGAQRREQQPGAAATVHDNVSTIHGPTPATNSNPDSAGVLDALQRLGLIGRPNTAGESAAANHDSSSS